MSENNTSNRGSMRAQTFVERLNQMSSPYAKDDNESLRRKERLVTASVKKRIETFLRTVRGSVRMDPTYGMDEPALVSLKMGSGDINEKEAYLNHLAQKLLTSDRRIAKVMLNQGNHLQAKTSQAIPFVEIKVVLMPELGTNEYQEPYSFLMAYDLTGRVFEVRQAEV